MIPLNDAPAREAEHDTGRVEAWCGEHADVWHAWSARWQEATGEPLLIVEPDTSVVGTHAPISGNGVTFAVVGGAARCDPLAPWLRGIADLIGHSLAQESELNSMTDELVDSYDQLTFLYEIARMLSTATTLSDALTKLLAQARHIIGAHGGALVIEQPEKPRLLLADGQIPPEEIVLAAHRAVSDADRGLVANDPLTAATAIGVPPSAAVVSMVVAPIVTPQGTATAACFGATKSDGFTAGNRKLMQAVAEQSIAIAGQFALQEEQIRRSRLARDLELAAQIQTALLPAPFAPTPRISIVATMVPANEVGGDFFTHPERVADDEAIAIAIGDVAGKGVAAALMTTVSLSAMRAEMRHVTSPATALRAVQGFIADELSRIDSFVTCILATYDPTTRTLAYANAGHNALLRWSARAGCVHSLGATGLPLGIDVGIDVEDASVTLDPGDVLLFHTDGVTEATAADGELFGDERLQSLLVAQGTRPPGQILDIILDEVRAFAPVQRDDITLIILKVEA